MTLNSARRTLAGLSLPIALPIALAVSALTGCDRGVPPLVLAPRSPSALTVYVDPDATVGEVIDERGRPIVPLLSAAIGDALTQAGYQVVANGTADLTVHLDVGRIGFAKYGQARQPWAEKAKLVVLGGGAPIAEERRPTVNWSDYEGSTTDERIRSAARRLVNHLSSDLRVVAYARNPTAASVGAGSGPTTAMPATGGTVATVPAESTAVPSNGGAMTPVTAGASTPSAPAAGATTLGPAVPATAPLAPAR